MLKLIASAFAGAATFFGSLFGMHHGMPANGQPNGSSTPPFGQSGERMGSTTPGWGHMGMGSTTPGVIGKVTVVNGTTITVEGRGNGSTATTTYSVDASNATVMKIGTGTTTASSIKVGDTVLVGGTVSGTSVTATRIIDGLMMMGPGNGKGMGPGNHPGGPGGWGRGSSTPPNGQPQQ